MVQPPDCARIRQLTGELAEQSMVEDTQSVADLCWQLPLTIALMRTRYPSEARHLIEGAPDTEHPKPGVGDLKDIGRIGQRRDRLLHELSKLRLHRAVDSHELLAGDPSASRVGQQCREEVSPILR